MYISLDVLGLKQVRVPCSVTGLLLFFMRTVLQLMLTKSDLDNKLMVLLLDSNRYEIVLIILVSSDVV